MRDVDLEREVARYLRAGCAQRWRRRMGFARRLLAVKATLRAAKAAGLLTRFTTVSIKPGHSLRFGGGYVHPERGGCRVTAYTAGVGYTRILVIFP